MNRTWVILDLWFGNELTATNLASVERDKFPSGIVSDWLTASDNSCSVHWSPKYMVAKSNVYAKFSLSAPGPTSSDQPLEELKFCADCENGRRSLSNASYAFWLANAEVKYHVGRGVSKLLPEDFLEVRLGDARALVRNVDKDLRTISFDYRDYSAVDLLDMR